MRRMFAIIVLIVVGLAVLTWLVRQAEPRFAFFPFPGEDATPAQFGVDFTPFTISTRDGEQLRAWHLPRADAVAQVVYFHGNGANLSLWADVLVGLWKQGFDVVAIDYRGYGVSTGKPSEGGLYMDVEATIADVNERLRRTDLPLIYWGRSLGATMAAYGARHHPPDAVVFESGFPSARALFDTNPVMQLLSYLATYRFATAEWMATVHTPALVMHGDRDSVIPYRMGQRLFEALPGPKRFVTIRGGDHNDAVPADADRYWGAVQDFVKTLRPRGSPGPGQSGASGGSVGPG